MKLNTFQSNHGLSKIYLKTINMTIRQKIQATMTAQGITAYALCKQLGINQGTFSRYIHGGTIPEKQLEKILNHLNLIKWN